MKVRSEIPTAENTTNMDGFGTCEVGTTLENLKAAIGGETGASAKYAAFAQAAKEQGYDQIARLFEATTSASSTRSSPKSSPTSRSRPPLRPRACRPT